MSPGSYSRGWDLGLLGVNLFFPNMVVWHIKLKGIVSRKVKCSPYGQTCDLEV